MNKKLKNLDISPDFYTHSSTMEDFLKIVKKCKDKKDLSYHIKRQLMSTQDSYFTDFSFLMGLQFGVYNLYAYHYISWNVKKRLTNSDPSEEESREVIQNYGSAIAKYIEKKYHIGKEYTDRIMKDLFRIKEDNPYFQNEIVEDIGKMMMSYYMMFQGKEIKKNRYIVNDFFETGKAILFFDQNNTEKQIRKS